VSDNVHLLNPVGQSWGTDLITRSKAMRVMTLSTPVNKHEETALQEGSCDKRQEGNSPLVK